jgi:hypothetical protein
MKKSTLYGLIVAMVGAGASANASADPEMRRFCSDSLVRGTYAIQMQGTRPSSPGGAMETVIGVVVRHYDGRGGIVQSDNIKGAISGYIPDRYGVGTYRVNDDCTVDIEFNPAPNLKLQERAVIVDNGNELRSITVLPAAVMVSGVHIRI